MKKFDVEISGSKNIKYQIDTFKELKRIAKKANGMISITEGKIETFYGTGQQLLDRIKVTEEYQKESLRLF